MGRHYRRQFEKRPDCLQARAPHHESAKKRLFHRDGQRHGAEGGAHRARCTAPAKPLSSTWFIHWPWSWDHIGVRVNMVAPGPTTPTGPEMLSSGSGFNIFMEDKEAFQALMDEWSSTMPRKESRQSLRLCICSALSGIRCNRRPPDRSGPRR